MTTSIVGLKGMDHIPIGYWPRTRLFSENNQVSVEHDLLVGLQTDFTLFADSFPARTEDNINTLPTSFEDTDEPDDLLSDASADSASSQDAGKRIIDSPPISIIDPPPFSTAGFSLLQEDVFFAPRRQETPIIPKKADEDFLSVEKEDEDFIFVKKEDDQDALSIKKKREKSFSIALRKAYHDGWGKVSATDLPGKKPPKKLLRDKSIKMSHRRKQPKLKSRWTLFCTHCGDVFLARPTPKNSRYVVNHVCSGNDKKRRQFVLGVKSRRCNVDHDGACVHRILPVQRQT